MKRRLISVIAATAIASVSGVAAAHADVVNPTPLTTHVSAHGASLEIVGYSANNGVIFNDRSNGNVYAVNPDGTNLHVVVHEGRAYAVAGGLIEYEDLTSPTVLNRFLDLDTLADGARTGLVGVDHRRRRGAHPAPERRVAPVLLARHRRRRAGLRRDERAAERPEPLHQHHLLRSTACSSSGWTATATPRRSSSRHRTRRPTTRSNTSGSRCRQLLRLPPRQHRHRLRGKRQRDRRARSGRDSPPRPSQRCQAISAMSCSRAAPPHSHAYTTYDVLDDFDVFCPCRVHFTNGTVITGLDTPTIVSDDATHAHVYYVKGEIGHDVGIYRSQFGHGAPQLVARAPRAPLDAIVPALGPGRAVWSDDSTASGGTWVTRRFAARWRAVAGCPGAGHRRADVVLPRVGHPHGLPRPPRRARAHPVAPGDDSGFEVSLRVLRLPRALPRDAAVPGHIWIYDLRDGSRWDATSHLHLAVPYTTPLLDGNYLTYFRSNGTVWRKNLASSHAPAQLGPAISHFAIGTVFGSGNWVAWSAFHETGVEQRRQVPQRARRRDHALGQRTVEHRRRLGRGLRRQA